MCALCVTQFSSALHSSLSSSRALLYINKHQIHFAFHLFPNTLTALEQTHVFKISARIELYLETNIWMLSELIFHGVLIYRPSQ